MKRKTIISIIVSLIVLGCVAVTIYMHSNNKYKDKANKSINTLNDLINSGDYKEAYNYYNENADKYNDLGYDEKFEKELDMLLEKENETYNSSITLLKNNEDGNFQKAKESLLSYIDKFNFNNNENISKAQSIISLIDSYNEKLKEYNSLKNSLISINDNYSLLNTIEGYINDLDNFHSAIGGAISGMDYSSALNAYNTWNSNSGYYYSMSGNISSISSSISNCVLSEGELNTIYSYISTGISPGEYMNSVIGTLSGYKEEIKNGTVDTSIVDGGTVSNFLGVYSSYDNSKNNVVSLINNKKDYLSKSNDNLKIKESEINKIKEELLNK